MKQSATLYFESDAFVDAPGSDEATNPGVFGQALASWLSEQLTEEGYGAGAIFAEDFGWCVPLQLSVCKLYVACASAEASQTHWQVFVFAERGLFSRFRAGAQQELAVTKAFNVLKSVLGQSPAVRALREEVA